ncbi:uncharacterized protein [Nicotiana tomentosiformis]|uniref:uncharacterized protein n=1 Tax=Nicotiana tomentosiformis TaxID=4098 RepID=UPI00388C8D9A
MEIYAKSYDIKVWRVIKKENYPLPAARQPLADPEDINKYSDEQMAIIQFNAKAQNLLYNAISGEEYEKIPSCDTVKKIWDMLEVTYERTNKVKETQINLLVHDYKLLQMKEGESIEEIFARFSKIIGNLKAFGKPYSSGREEENIRLQTTTKGPENDIDADTESLEEEIAMMSRNMNELMRSYRNTKKGRMSSRRTRQYNEQDKNDGKCFECRRYSHVQAECSYLKRKVSRGFNKNKSFERRGNENSSEHKEIANLYFMTILENDMNKYFGCWTDEDVSNDDWKEDTKICFMARGETSEVRPYNCDRCNKLHDILDLTPKESQKMLNELKRLNREKKDWELKLEVCEIEETFFKIKFRNCKCNSIECTNPPVTVLSSLTKRLTNQLENDLLELSPQVLIPVIDQKLDQPICVITVTRLDINIPSVDLVNLIFQDGFRSPKTVLILVELRTKDPSKLGYLKEGDNFILKEHHRKSRKAGKQTTNSFKAKDIVSTTKPLQLLHMNLFGPTRTASIGELKEKKGISSQPYKVTMEENLKVEPLKNSATIKDILTISQPQDHPNRMGCLIRPILKKTPYKLWKDKRPNIGYFHLFGSKYFIHNNGKDNLGKFDPRSDEGIFLGYSINSRSFRVYNKRTLSVEESMHVIFDDSNTMVGKGIIAGDEDISQEASQTNKSHKSTDSTDIVTESISEPVSNHTKPQKESTTPVVGTRPNEWRSEPEYPQKFIIGDPNGRMKTREALKKKANIALISQIEPKKIDEALKDSRWVQAMQDELDQFNKNQVWELVPKPANATVIGTK